MILMHDELNFLEISKAHVCEAVEEFGTEYAVCSVLKFEVVKHSKTNVHVVPERCVSQVPVLTAWRLALLDAHNQAVLCSAATGMGWNFLISPDYIPWQGYLLWDDKMSKHDAKRKANLRSIAQGAECQWSPAEGRFPFVFIFLYWSLGNPNLQKASLPCLSSALS